MIVDGMDVDGCVKLCNLSIHVVLCSEDAPFSVLIIIALVFNGIVW